MENNVLGKVYFINVNSTNVNNNSLFSNSIDVCFEKAGSCSKKTLNDNLKFSSKNKYDMGSLEEKMINYVDKFLFNKNIEKSRAFVSLFINYQLIKRILNSISSDHPIIKSLTQLGNIQFIFSIESNADTIFYQIRLNKAKIDTFLDKQFEPIVFDLLFNIKYLNEINSHFLINFYYEKYKEENLNILYAKNNADIINLIERTTVLNSFKFKIKEIREFISVEHKKSSCDRSVFLNKMDNWLQNFNLQDASLDYIKINAAIIYGVKLFLTQPNFTGFNIGLIEEILLIITRNNEVPKASILNSINTEHRLLSKINFINKFSVFLNTRSDTELLAFYKELELLSAGIYSNSLINELNNVTKLLAQNLIGLSIVDLSIQKKKKIKKKVKTRIIEFDSNGKGVDIKKSRKPIISLSKQATDNAADKLEVYERYRKSLSFYENQSQLTRDLREAYILRLILRKEKPSEEIRYERSFSDIFRSIALEELKCFFFKKIVNIKEKISIKTSAYYKEIFFLTPPIFLDRYNKYLKSLLRVINFSMLKKLIEEAHVNLDNILKIRPIFEKIEKFFNEWDSEWNIDFNDFFQDIKQSYGNAIVNYVEEVFKLMDERNLMFDESKDKNNLSYEINGTSKKIIFDEPSLFEEINSMTLSLSIENFLKHQIKIIKDYLEKHYLINLNKIHNVESRISLFSILFVKFKHFISNYFDINFFINNSKNLKFFAAKFYKSNLNKKLDRGSVQRYVCETQWWHFVAYGMNPLFLLNCNFKQHLSEQLFLHIINDKFKEIVGLSKNAKEQKDEGVIGDLIYKKDILKHIEQLFVLYSLLEIEINVIDERGCGFQIIKSKQDIITLVKSGVLTEFSRLISDLRNNLDASVNKFSTLLNVTLEGIKNLKSKQSLPISYIPGSCLFRLPKNNSEKNVKPFKEALKI